MRVAACSLSPISPRSIFFAVAITTVLLLGGPQAAMADGCSTLATTLPGSNAPFTNVPVSLTAGDVITTTLTSNADFFIENPSTNGDFAIYFTAGTYSFTVPTTQQIQFQFRANNFTISCAPPPPIHDFGTVNLGSSSNASVTISFTAPTTVASVSVVTQGATGKDFQATTPDASSGLCTATTYTSGQSCTVDVTFAPLAPGERLGAAVLRDSSNRIVASGYVRGTGAGAQLGFTAPTVSTFVGTGTYSATNPSGSSGTSAGFIHPKQIAFDGSGNMYLADSLASMIYKITPVGLVSTVLGTYRTSCGTTTCGYPTSNSTTLASTSSVDLPASIVVDGAGLLWFIDNSIGGVATVDLTSGYVTAQVPGTTGAMGAPATSGNIHTLGAASLGTLISLGTDGLGNIYVGTYYDSSTSPYGMIIKLDFAGNVSVFAGSTSTSSGASAPADGTLATSAIVGDPGGIGFDASGNCYYFDSAFNQIFTIDTAGKVHPFAGSGSVASDNTSSLPYWQSGTASTTSSLSVNLATNVGMLAVDPSGNVFLPSAPSSYSDSNSSSRVFVFTPSGSAYVLAGTGAIGETNGPASSSELAQPTSIALNGTGDIYISESYLRQSSATPAVYVGSSVRKWSMAASTLSFASQAMGSTSAGQTVTATNLGNAALELTSPSSGTNPNPGSSFSLLNNTASNTCGTGTSGAVAAGSNCSVIAAFSPNQPSGSISGNLVYTGNLPGGMTSVPMTGIAAPGVASLKLTGLPTLSTSATPNTVTVSAYNASNSIFSSYTGTVHFSLSPVDVSAALPSDYAFTASDSGSKTFSVALSAPGAHTLTVTDALDNLTASQGTTVAAAVNHFGFTGVPSNATAGAGFTGTVTAYSSSDNSTVATGYSGPVKFTSTDGSAVLPGSTTLTAGVSSALTFTLKTAGSQTITVADSSGSPSTSSGSIVVSATTAASISATQGASQNAIIGASFPTALQVQVTDAYSNPVGGVVVTFTPPATGPSAVLSASTCTTSTTATIGSCSVTATANGTASTAAYTVIAKPAGVTTGASFSLNNLKYTPTVSLAEQSSALVYGQAESVTATFAPASVAGTAPSTGITFYDNGTLLSAAPVSSGSATLSNLRPTVGTHTYTASYAGDSNFNASSVATATPNVVVNKASATVTAQTQSLSLNDGQSGVIPVVVTGQYSGAGIAVPSATVSYTILNSASASVATGSVTLASGAASVPITSTLAPGPYTVNMTYGGDGNYAAATSPAVVNLVVSQIQTTINWAQPAAIPYGATLAGALNATAMNGTTVVPGTMTYTATATVGGASPVTGGIILPAGAYTLAATFTPTDTSMYKSATATVPLVVNKATAGISLTTSANTVLVQNPVTFTATVSSVVSPPTGTVTFFDGTSTTTPIGTATLTGSVATLTTSSLAIGTHTITAVYSGDTNFVTASSPALLQTVQDFNLSISTSSGSSTTATVVPGGTANYTLIISPTGSATFPAKVALTVSGLPAGATYTLTPSSIAAGSGTTNVILAIQVPATTAMLHMSQPFGKTVLPIALGLLLLPFSRRMRKSAKRLGRTTSFLLLLLAGTGAVAGLTGCGVNTGYFGQLQHSYSVSVTGTSGALVHSTTVTLNVQ